MGRRIALRVPVGPFVLYYPAQRHQQIAFHVRVGVFVDCQPCGGMPAVEQAGTLPDIMLVNQALYFRSNVNELLAGLAADVNPGHASVYNALSPPC